MRTVVLLMLIAFGAPALPARAAETYAMMHHPTSTTVPLAQACFDRGMTLFFAYNRLASQAAFECAAKADPYFAMAYWGIALAHGTNINFGIDAAGEKAAYAAIVRAMALQNKASGADRAYIATLAMRYSDTPSPNLRALAVAYEKAMKALSTRYPDDVDAAALYAESAMELHSWMWYTPRGLPVGNTKAILKTLEGIRKREPDNIAANHLYIHMTEGSVHPQLALTSAARLRSLSFEAAAAHLVHMPAHTYMRTGDFAAAAEVNEHASKHDMSYLAKQEDPEASIYHDHNLTMLAAAYANEGNLQGATRIARMLIADHAYVPAMFAYLRFKRWNDILKMSMPLVDNAEPYRIGVWHFARGMTLAGTGQLPAAQADLAAVNAARKTLHVPSAPGNYNSSEGIFALASDLLGAKIAGAQRKSASQISLLRAAAALQDRFLYIEPPDWYAPVRESLGAALLTAGYHAAAAAAFREDLLQNPRNPRSLFGLYRSLTALHEGQDAALVRRDFDRSWKHADTKLKVSDL